MKIVKIALFEFLFEFGELEGDDDSQNSNNDSVN